jgi:hypothetical protein
VEAKDVASVVLRKKKWMQVAIRLGVVEQVEA